MGFLDWWRRRRPDPTPKPIPEPSPSPVGLDDALLLAHNTFRSSRKLKELSLNAKLGAAAKKHASEMARTGVMSHKGFPGRVVAEGYSYTNVGENIAEGYTSASTVMTGWEGSSGHRANILGWFLEVGFGMAQSTDGTKFWCAIFGVVGVGEYVGKIATSGALREN